MTFEELIDSYLENTDTKTMTVFARKINDFIEDIRERHPDKVDTFLCQMDLLLNPDFSKDGALEAVSVMKNKDGSTGEHWSYESAERLKRGDFKTPDWYYVLNMMYSDYYKQGRSEETYAELAHDFLADEDAPEHKAKIYYLSMTQTLP